MPSVIGLGSSGDDVKRLQRLLARVLLWNSFRPITGVFDDGLETSVKSFPEQRADSRRRCWPHHLGQSSTLSRGFAHLARWL